MGTLVAIDLVLSIGRYAIRYAIRRSFYWDHLFHGLVVLTLIAMVPLLDLTFLENDSEQTEKNVWLFYVAMVLAFVLCIWSVKLSFLFFLRLVFWTNRTFRIAWYIVTVATLLVFCIPLAMIVPHCNVDRLEQDLVDATSDYIGDVAVR